MDVAITAYANKGGTYYINHVYRGHRLAKSTRSKERREAARRARDMIREFHVKVDEMLAAVPQPAPDAALTYSAVVGKLWTTKWRKADDGQSSRRLALHFSELMGDMAIDDVTKKICAEYKERLCLTVKTRKDPENPSKKDQARTRRLARASAKGKTPPPEAAEEPKYLSTATVNRYMTALRTVLNYAADNDYIQAAPKIKADAESQHTSRINRDEQAELIKHIRAATTRKAGGKVGEEIFMFLIETGCRLSEAVKATWERNIDLRAGQIRFLVTKNDKARNLPLTEYLGMMLNFKVAEMNGIKRSLSKDELASMPMPTGRIWPDVTAGDFDDVWDIARRKMSRSDDKEFTPHILRHTCASRLAEEGFSLHEIGLWLGHKTPKTTQRYIHYLANHLDPLAAALNRQNKERYFAERRAIRDAIQRDIGQSPQP